MAELSRAAEAFAAERFGEAARILRPLRDRYPQAAGVLELLGLAQYRQGHYPAAAETLEAFRAATGSTEQHPVLMDCRRAQRRYDEVERLWEELKAASPGAELVAEGRIVAAGALADQGRLAEAIHLLEAKVDRLVAHPREHHLRLWYALADLLERSGDIPRARSLFERVARADPRLADVAERLAALG